MVVRELNAIRPGWSDDGHRVIGPGKAAVEVTHQHGSARSVELGFVLARQRLRVARCYVILLPLRPR